MNEEEIRGEARKAADRSQFKSNYIYNHKSYEDGFYEGMSQSFALHNVEGRSEQLKCDGCFKTLKEETCYCEDCFLRHSEL